MKKIIALVLSLIVIMGLSVTAFAAKSPGGTVYHKVVVINGANAKADPVTYVDSTSFSVTADANKGNFNSWTVYKADGTVAKLDTDYKIVSGSLKDATATIMPLSDIIVCGNYNNTTTNPITGAVNTPESPKTGDMTVVYISLAMMAALGCAVVAKKQLAK